MHVFHLSGVLLDEESAPVAERRSARINSCCGANRRTVASSITLPSSRSAGSAGSEPDLVLFVPTAIECRATGVIISDTNAGVIALRLRVK
jgi:hypothetical protein